MGRLAHGRGERVKESGSLGVGLTICRLTWALTGGEVKSARGDVESAWPSISIFEKETHERNLCGSARTNFQKPSRRSTKADPRPFGSMAQTAQNSLP